MPHLLFLLRCLALAEQGRGKTGTNPMVGAVLVRDGTIIAEGFHEGFGKPHAESMLLNLVKEQKIDSSYTLYVSLEPCFHTNKKTPPCVQLLLKRGIKNVVIGMVDPNPAVAGKGIALLRKHGVNVRIAYGMTADCLRLNRGFVSLQTKNRPWITLKRAMTVAKKYAKDDGSPLKITTAEQDTWSHQFLRARHDAILVGIGTILHDDPQLTVRPPSPGCLAEPGGGVGGGGLYRIILDPTLKIPLTAKVVSGELTSRTIVIVSAGVDAIKDRELESRGVTVHKVPLRNHVFDWDSLWKKLTTPNDDFYGISSILVEGGVRTWEILRKAGVVDEEVTLVGK